MGTSSQSYYCVVELYLTSGSGIPPHANWAAHENGHADGLATAHPFSGYGRATTLAPNPDWVPPFASGNFLAPAATAYQPAHGYTRGPAQPTLPNQSNHSTAVTADHDNDAAPVYSSVDSQSRARTEAPDPAFSDSVEAQINGEAATAKAPMWWEVDEA
ncbi:hypothetical protein PG990_002886 [Apiospora arundinis]